MQSNDEKLENIGSSCRGRIIVGFGKASLFIVFIGIAYIVYYLFTINIRVTTASNNSVAMADLRNLKTNLDKFRSENGQFPGSLA